MGTDCRILREKEINKVCWKEPWPGEDRSGRGLESATGLAGKCLLCGAQLTLVENEAEQAPKPCLFSKWPVQEENASGSRVTAGWVLLRPPPLKLRGPTPLPCLSLEDRVQTLTVVPDPGLKDKLAHH